jgi:release factor glutamine methyltransferase
MTSMRRAIDEAADTLTAAGIDTARVDAEQLAAHTAGVDRGRLTWHEPDATFLDRYRELVAALAALDDDGRVRSGHPWRWPWRLHPASGD